MAKSDLENMLSTLSPPSAAFLAVLFDQVIPPKSSSVHDWCVFLRGLRRPPMGVMYKVIHRRPFRKHGHGTPTSPEQMVLGFEFAIAGSVGD